MNDGVPAYEDLPRVGESEDRHAWDVWGRSDSLGSVNRLTAARVLAGVGAVRQGRVISLDLPLDTPEPSVRPPYDYILSTSKGGRDDRVDNFYLQRSSQIDGLGHVKLRQDVYWGGRREGEFDAAELGIDHWADHGLVGRGVLIDLARFADASGVGGYAPNARIALDQANIEAIAALEGVELSGTDFLVLHTGWLEWFMTLSPDERRATLDLLPQGRLMNPGLDGSRTTAAWMWDVGIVGALADNVALEVLPVIREEGFQHRRLIPMLGMVVGELIDTAALASDCAADGQFDFMVSLMPLKIPGAVGSPSNAYVIK